MTKYKRKTNRQPVRLQNKIIRKERQNVKKIKRAAKKAKEYNKALGIKPIAKKDFQIPSKAPFAKKLIDEYEEELQNKKKTKNSNIVEKALNENSNVIYGDMDEALDDFTTSHDKSYFATSFTKYNYLLNKVIEKSDVLINVLDARDPLSCISDKLLNKLKSYPDKKVLFVLNKVDLIPEPLIYEWLKILKRMYPTVAFKANLQKSQKDHYSDIKLYSKTMQQASFVSVEHSKETKKHLIEKDPHENPNQVSNKLFEQSKTRLNNILDSNKTVGLDELMNLLKNYTRDQSSKKLMHAITVGVVGFPNVGKSSLINSMKRCRAVSVKNTPGSTKALQEIKIDKHVTLIDSPGIVLESEEKIARSLILSAIVDYNQLDDTLIFIDKILKRKSKFELMEELDVCDWEKEIKMDSGMAENVVSERKNNLSKIFKDQNNLKDFNSDSTMKFLYAIGAKYNKFKKQGIPDVIGAAKFILGMWNEGKIKWYVKPEIKDKNDMEE